MAPSLRRSGFTVVELVVSVAVVVVLAGLLFAMVGRLRTRLQIVEAHNDLRQVTLSIQLYRNDHHGDCPPTRYSCSTGAVYPLPVELLDYGLPRGRNSLGADTIAMEDPFTPGTGYHYRAVGRAIMNETTIIDNSVRLWVPDGFPRRTDGAGRYHKDPRTSPVRYAVWSMGADPDTEKFDVPGRLPVPAKYWMHGAGDEGVIVHIQSKDGDIIVSP